MGLVSLLIGWGNDAKSFSQSRSVAIHTWIDEKLGDVPSFCSKIFTSQSTWVITVLCFFFGLATAPVLLTKWDDTVSSPNYPLTYPTNTTLTWIKTVSSGNRITITISDFQVRNSEDVSQPAHRRSKYRAILHLFERLFLISWENNRDCHITMPLSLKTIEVHIKGNQWNKRFRTVQVYWGDPTPIERLFLIGWENNRDCHITIPLSLKTIEVHVQIKGDQWIKRFRTVQVYWKYSQLKKSPVQLGSERGRTDCR